MENITYAYSDYVDFSLVYDDVIMNATVGPPASSPPQANVVQSIAFAVSTVLIILSNTLTLVVLHQQPLCFEEIPRLIFQALAVTDLLTGMSCCFFSFVFSCAPHLQNSATCAIRTMSCTGCLNHSALIMAFATVDRYIAITQPLRYFSILTFRRARIVVTILASVSISNALFTNVGADFHSSQSSCVSDFTAVGIGISFRPSLLVILLIFYSSISIATFANCKVVRVALRHSRVVADKSTAAARDATGNNANRNPGLSNRVKLRSLRAVFVATVTFYIAVIPWNIMASLHFADHVKIPQPLRIAAAYLLINNSWFNSVIYALMNSTFRRAAKRALQKYVCLRKTDDIDVDSSVTEGNSYVA